jgi:hypothetical protein
MMARFFCICLCIVLIACGRSSEIQKDLFEQGVIAGVLDSKKIDEASGLAASHTYPGMLWTHNDSGDKARIFLIDSIGRYQATVLLKGFTNRDWEDIAVGPGPERDKTYVYVGEIGDNLAKYEYKYIYRLQEPELTTKDTTVEIEQIDSIKFKLPDGIRDCEALMIDPDTRDLYIFSKRESAVNLYRLPYPQSTIEIMVAEKVLEALPFTLIVAADWSPDGKEILIKNYEQVYYWRRENNESITELLKTPPVLLPYHQEPQGESIAFDYYGKGYYTLSEKAKGVKPALMFYKRIDTQ